MTCKTRFWSAGRVCIGIVWLLTVFAATVPGRQSLADDYPSRRVRVIIPYSPGGSPDVLFRVVAQALSVKWGQPVVIENRPGGNTFIGASAVVNSPADGYTLMLTADNTFVINPLFYTSMPYAMSDLVPITLVGTAPHMFAITKNAPARNAQEFIAWAKANPDTIMYGTDRTGRLATARDGAVLAHRRHQADAGALQGGAGGGHCGVDRRGDGVDQQRRDHHAACRIGRDAHARRRDRTARGAGAGDPDPAGAGRGRLHVARRRSACLLPRRCPTRSATRSQADVAEVLRQPEIKKYLEERGFEPHGESAAEFSRFIAAETEKWRRVITEANIKAE